MVKLSFAFLTCALMACTAPAIAGDAEAGKEKSAQCETCHGADGNGINPTFPRLAGQYADYLVKALEDYKSGARQNAIMAGFAASLSDEDRADIAAYYANMDGGVAVLESDD